MTGNFSDLTDTWQTLTPHSLGEHRTLWGECEQAAGIYDDSVSTGVS